MKSYRKLVTLFAFALAATVLAVGSAFAQMNTTKAQGTFTLPFEAHWGSATLPAGNYTFKEVAGGLPLIEVRNEAKGSTPAFVIIAAHDASQDNNSSELVCIRLRNAGIVRSIVLTSLGETLYFKIPKNVRMYAHNSSAKTRTLLAQGPELIQRVPVEVAGQ